MSPKKRLRNKNRAKVGVYQNKQLSFETFLDKFNIFNGNKLNCSTKNYLYKVHVRGRAYI